MKTKKLSNSLAAVVCELAEDNCFNCNILVSSEDIICMDWKFNFIPEVALRSVFQFCEHYGLLFFVDIENNLVRLVIHG